MLSVKSESESYNYSIQDMMLKDDVGNEHQILMTELIDDGLAKYCAVFHPDKILRILTN